jgi:hypothetical protein
VIGCVAKEGFKVTVEVVVKVIADGAGRRVGRTC